MRIAITGGGGFIGANLARTLLEASHDVVVLDNFSTSERSNLDGVDVELLEGSILDEAKLDRAFAQVQAVVHLAALASVPRSLQDPVSCHDVNVTGTMRVLEAVRRAGSPYVVAASSSSVYGSNPALPKHEDLAPAPVSPYAASKLAMEAYTLAWASAYGLDALAFRFFNVFGPLQPPRHSYAAVIPAFVDAAVSGRPLPVHGDGTQTRDFTYVGTVCAVIASAIERRVAAPGPVNLAFGSRISLLELIAALEAIVGQPLDREHLEPRAGDVRDSQADTARLLSLFPQIETVPMEEGLAATVEWFRRRR